jgi:hypothetical protein
MHDKLNWDHPFRHCEERSDEAIHQEARRMLVDCFTPLSWVRNDEGTGNQRRGFESQLPTNRQ